MTMPSWFFFFVGIIAVVCCHSDKSVQHLVLLDDYHLPSPIQLTIRSDFKGVAEFIESDKFQIVLNITAASVEEAYLVQHDLIEHRGGLLLQLHKSQPKAWFESVTWPKIAGTIVSLVSLTIVISTIYSCWWYRHQPVKLQDSGHDDQGQDQPLIYQANTVDVPKHYSETVVFADGLQRLRSDYSVDGHSSREEVPTQNDIRKRPAPKRYVKPKLPRKPSSDDDEDDDNITLPKRQVSPRKTQKFKVQHANDDTDSGTCVGTVEYSGQSSGDDSYIEQKHRIDRLAAAPYHDRGQILPMSSLEESPNKINVYSNLHKNGHLNLGKSPGRADHTGGGDGTRLSDEEVRLIIARGRQGNDKGLRNEERTGRDSGRLGDGYGRVSTRIGPGRADGASTARMTVQGAGNTPMLPSHSDIALQGSNLPDESKSRLKQLQEHATLPLRNVEPEHNVSVCTSVPKAMMHETPQKTVRVANNESAKMMDTRVHKETLINGDKLIQFKQDPTYSIGQQMNASPAKGDYKKENMNYIKGFSPTKSPKASRKKDVNPHKIVPVSLPIDKMNISQTDESLDTMYVPRSPSTNVLDDDKPCLSTFQPQSSSTIRKSHDSKKGKNEGQNSVRTAGKGSAAKNVHVATVFSVCILGLITGVYCVATTETTVTVLVFAPRGYLSNKTAVYFNRDRPGRIKTGEGFSVIHSNVKNAILGDLNSTLCDNNQCTQGCDENSGECICQNGFIKHPSGQCVDIDECLDSHTHCSPYASCQNVFGDYRCICGEGYYGNGRLCRDCREPCETGKFEVQPCVIAKNQKKICKDCTRRCQTNYYIHEKCTTSHDTVCRMCKPYCGETEYMFTSCTSTTNRQCRGSSELHAPRVSHNVLYEDRYNLTDFTARVTTTPDEGRPHPHSFVVHRGSGLRVELKIKYINLDPRVEPVYYEKVSERSLPRRRDLRQQYCPQPLPEYYRLQYTLHENMTYRELTQRCQNAFSPCDSYKRYGSFPNLIPPSRGRVTFAYASQNTLTTIFRLNARLMKKTVVETEVSDRCGRMRSDCDRCSATCASQMGNERAECKATEHEADNGWSPRLRLCYNCCVNKSRCVEMCEAHNKPSCASEKCYRGNIVEFELKPMYPVSGSTFYCSVRPIRTQVLAQIEYHVTQNNRSLVSRHTVSVSAEDTWVTRGFQSLSDGLMDIEVESHVEQLPDVIMGELSSGAIIAGMYVRSGGEVRRATDEHHIAIHPKQPFDILHNDWSKLRCSEDILSHFLTTTPKSRPFTSLQGVNARFSKRQTYAITNATAGPSIQIHIPRKRSVLATLYNWASVYFESLTGDVTHTGDRWHIAVKGDVVACPGVFSVNITDGNQASQRLFTYDIYVQCPRSFTLIFTLPTGDSPDIRRDFIVTIRDAKQTIQMVIQKPEKAREVSQASKHDNISKVKAGVESEKSKDTHASGESFPLSVPFVSAVCGAVGLLVFMASFGIIMDNGIPDPDTVSRLHPRHAVMMVAYIAAQVLYSLIFSLTTFVCVWVTVNSEAGSFLQHYNQQTVLQKALNSLELGRMQQHLVAEIARQTRVANDTEAKCDENIRRLVQELEKTQEGLFKSRNKRSHWKKVKALVHTHTKYILGNYTEQLLKYREDFNRFTSYQMDRLVFNVEQTYRSLQDNRWIKGPKYIREAVQNLRNLHNAGDTRLLLHWLGVDLDFNKFTNKKDMTMPMPPLPDLNAFLPQNLTWRSMTPSPKPTLPPITHIYNHWLSQSHDSVVMDALSPDTDDRGTVNEKLGGTDKNKIYALIMVMVLVDVVWLLHRLVKACRVGMLMLYGYPWYLDYRHDTQSNTGCDCCTCTKTEPDKSLPRLFHKLVHSHFLPKAVMTGAVVLMVYVVLTLNAVYVNKASLSTIGYYNHIEELLDLNQNVINKRIESNAQRINTVEYKSYESTLNAYIKRHMLLLEIQHRQLAEGSGGAVPRMHLVHGHGCRFDRLTPIFYHRRSEAESLLLAQHTDPMIESVSHVITHTSVLVLAFLAVVVIKQLLDMVIWLYVKRSGLVRLRVIYETNQEPVIQETNYAGM